MADNIFTPLPRLSYTYSDVYANLPTTGLTPGLSLAYATDRKVFYRWSGTAWVPLTFYNGSGLAADIPDAGNLPNGSLYYETDTALIKQVQAGAWVSVTPAAYAPATGEYTGNDVSTRQITTGFKCIAVFIYQPGGEWAWIGDTTGVYAGVSYYSPDLHGVAQVGIHASDGFVVRLAATRSGMNVSGITYYYVAFPAP